METIFMLLKIIGSFTIGFVTGSHIAKALCVAGGAARTLAVLIAGVAVFLAWQVYTNVVLSFFAKGTYYGVLSIAVGVVFVCMLAVFLHKEEANEG